MDWMANSANVLISSVGRGNALICGVSGAHSMVRRVLSRGALIACHDAQAGASALTSRHHHSNAEHCDAYIIGIMCYA